MNRVVLCIVLFGMLNLACWNKQGHDVTRPEIPHYVLSGQTVDYVTGEPVPFTPVRIVGVAMVYGNSFPTQTLQSDSSGSYAIDPVYPGSYTIYTQKDDYWLKGRDITIEHNDRELDLDVTDIKFVIFHPKRYTISDEVSYSLADSRRPCFTISELQSFLPTILNYYGKKQGYHFCMANLVNYFAKYNTPKETTADLSSIKQFDVGSDKFYALKYPDTLMVIDRWQYDFLFQVKTGVSFVDIACNRSDNKWYGCTDSLLYEIEAGKLACKELFPLPETGISSMTWHNNYIYLFQKQRGLLFKVNLQLEIEEAFTLYGQLSNSLVTDLYDMHFDIYDKLWITSP